QAAVPAALRPRSRGDEDVRRLRREDDVRQEDSGRDPLDGLDRPGRQGEEALGEGRQRGGTPRQGAGSAARGLSAHSGASRQVSGCDMWRITTSLQYFCAMASATRVA